LEKGENSHLSRIESPLNQSPINPLFEPERMGDQEPIQIVRNILYPELVDEPSCIALPKVMGDRFKLKSNYIS
jgi:hypothetical protein